MSKFKELGANALNEMPELGPSARPMGDTFGAAPVNSARAATATCAPRPPAPPPVERPRALDAPSQPWGRR